MRKKTDLLIEPRWIAPIEPDTLLERHGLVVHAGQIIALAPIEELLRHYDPLEYLRLPEHLLVPGFVNLHSHAAMTLMRGLADDLPLMTWLEKHIWPTEAAHVSPGFVRDGTRLACYEMLKGGTTCFNDMYFHQGATAEAVDESGIRAVLGITALEFPTPFASDADDYLNKGLAVREHWLDHPRLTYCLAPHAPYTVSDKTFDRILTLSEQLDLPIHCHIHETDVEVNGSIAQHQRRPLQRLKELGLLGPGFIGVHGVHLTEDDIALLAQQACHIAHCPTSNLKLGSGLPPIAELVAAGVNVGLGTDGAASNNRLDMMQEMRLAALLAKGRSQDAALLPARQVLRMATLNGAKALGLDHRIGSLQPGKAADLCALDFSSLELHPCYDPISHLVYVAGREQVSHVWVDGKCLIRAKTLTNTDENDLKKRVALWQNKLNIRSES